MGAKQTKEVLPPWKLQEKRNLLYVWCLSQCGLCKDIVRYIVLLIQKYEHDSRFHEALFYHKHSQETFHNCKFASVDTDREDILKMWFHVKDVQGREAAFHLTVCRICFRSMWLTVSCKCGKFMST